MPSNPAPWGGAAEDWQPRGGYEPAPELFHEPHHAPAATPPATEPPATLTQDEDTPAFAPAPLTAYREWLTLFLDGGGTPTHFRDRPYGYNDILCAVRDFDTMGERGTAAANILIPAGVRHLGGPLVVVYNAPEFLELPGMAEFAKEQSEEERRRDAERKAELRRLDTQYADENLDRYLNRRRNAR